MGVRSQPAPRKCSPLKGRGQSIRRRSAHVGTCAVSHVLGTGRGQAEAHGVSGHVTRQLRRRGSHRRKRHTTQGPSLKSSSCGCWRRGSRGPAPSLRPGPQTLPSLPAAGEEAAGAQLRASGLAPRPALPYRLREKRQPGPSSEPPAWPPDPPLLTDVPSCAAAG